MMKDTRPRGHKKTHPRIEATPGKPGKGRNVPVSWFIITVVLLAGMILLLASMKFSRSVPTAEHNAKLTPDEGGVRRILNTDYQLVKPVVITEVVRESQELGELKMKISMLLHEKEREGTLLASGVYVKRMNTGDWICIGENQAFQAGSLLKVPIMITWLVMAQDDPSLLRKKLFFPQPRGTIPGQTFAGKSITPDKYYSVLELMSFMIEESDNNATYVLGQNMDIKIFQKLFTDLGLARPELGDARYSLTAAQYSRFPDVLYHATVVSPKLSQLGLEMMTKCSFKKGLTRDLPPGVLAAHKFGEQGMNGIAELSESGIFYLSDQPYLLTVMTKGADIDLLANVISLISNDVYKTLSH